MDETLVQGTVSSIGLDQPVRKRKLRPALLPDMQPQEDDEEGMAADPNRLQSMAQGRPMLGTDPMMDPKKRMKNGIQRPV